MPTILTLKWGAELTRQILHRKYLKSGFVTFNTHSHWRYESVQLKWPGGVGDWVDDSSGAKYAMSHMISMSRKGGEGASNFSFFQASSQSLQSILCNLKMAKQKVSTFLINWFLNVEQVVYIWHKSLLVVVCNSFCTLLDSFW